MQVVASSAEEAEIIIYVFGRVCSVMLRYMMLCYALLSFAMLWYVMLCHVVLREVKQEVAQHNIA